MINILDPILGRLRLNRAKVDNNIFSLHYGLTTILLVAFALIIGSRKYFGDPIDCIGGFGKFRPVIVDGVKNHEDLKRSDSKESEKLKPYFLHAYQWIEFILFIQAILFFFPRYLWRHCWEQGKVKTLTTGLSIVSTKIESDKEKLSEIAIYIKRSKYNNFLYAWEFIICEVLNFSNVLVQFLMVKSTLGLGWTFLVDDFFSSDSNINPENPINLAFPNMARCDVPAPGASGHYYSLEFCVLPLNVFVTKVYIFLWFYLLGLAVLSGFGLIYRIALLSFPKLRYFNLLSSVQGVPEYHTSLIENLDYSEWFLLRQVGKNIDPFTFDSLIKEYSSNYNEGTVSIQVRAENSE